MKLLLSAANDGTIIAWSAGGGIFDKVAVKLLSNFNIFHNIFKC